jgi:YegS/Rv2252/BmrU family lipid kinase
MKRFLFIINPKSGRGSKKSLVLKIKKTAGELNFEFEVIFTLYAGHATEIAKQAANEFDVVFAVGGDGTVNETAIGMLGSKTPLGIIPTGSGNGIARHLQVPINAIEALNVLTDGDLVNIDAWTAGRNPFFMLCGLGFDAHIAKMISGMKSRGLQAYIRLVTKEFSKFKPKEINISWEEGEYLGAPFLINFANGSQFGNNMKIAPKASITDGFLDLGIIEEFPVQLIPEIIFRMWNGTLHNFKYYKTFRAKAFKVKTDYIGINLDGEFRKTKNEFLVNLSPFQLRVLIAKNMADNI